eukprot:TRINITY_DN2098_c0_g2_i1.p1 TRINITY_DN2098_c0_g2~~TRINITY_DN2098_c0_g2_i1.p1  ORF type:complete len:447 (-),score=71.66 TRINITY_DN2098_c0_g2_i1:48-1388(-)
MAFGSEKALMLVPFFFLVLLIIYAGWWKTYYDSQLVLAEGLGLELSKKLDDYKLTIHELQLHYNKTISEKHHEIVELKEQIKKVHEQGNAMSEINKDFKTQVDGLKNFGRLLEKATQDLKEVHPEKEELPSVEQKDCPVVVEEKVCPDPEKCEVCPEPQTCPGLQDSVCRPKDKRFPDNFEFPTPDGRNAPPLSLEPSNLYGPQPTPRMDKHLVAVPVGNKAKPVVDKWVRKFGTNDFTFVFFVYDDSDWNEFDWHSKVVFIRYPKQGKYWYIKHFISVDIARAYKTVWLGDDDVDVEHIDPTAVLEAIEKNGIQMCQPAHAPGHRFSHPITVQQNQEGSVGRWVNFCEIGPLLIFSSKAYECAYTLIQPDLPQGWGYDLMFTEYCQFDKVAIVDKYPIIHLNYKTALGAPDAGWLSMEEMGTAFRRYRPIIHPLDQSTQRVYGRF